MAARLPSSVYLGTSSWAFPGWRGLVYEGSVTRELLARHGLTAYAHHPLLRAVGIDRSWYAPLPVSAFVDYAQQVPADFRFLVKAHRQCTSPRLDDARSGCTLNPHCLDAGYTAQAVVAPYCEGLGARAGALLFQFTPGSAAALGGAGVFVEKLHRFLDALPPGPCYAVEVRDESVLGAAYFHALAATGVRHCLSLHPRIGLERQLRGLATLPPGPLIARWNLHPDFHYEAARQAFSPFDALRRPDVQRRTSLARQCVRSLSAGQECLIIANNKAEGCAPLTLAALADAIVTTTSP